METFWFFRLRFRRAYDSAYDSLFRFSLGHKRSYVSDYDSDSVSVASENQPLGHNSSRLQKQNGANLKMTNLQSELIFSRLCFITRK